MIVNIDSLLEQNKDVMRLMLVRCNLCNVDCTNEYYAFDLHHVSLNHNNELVTKTVSEIIDVCPNCFKKLQKLLPEILANLEWLDNETDS